jgi:UDP-N-acetylglucosamine 1-carboxyvinyltransferase
MDQLVIEGSHPLKGTIRISGAKNAALPILAATLLTGGTFRLKNIPRLVDIRTFSDLLTDLGVMVEYSTDNDSDFLNIDSSGLSDHEAPYDLVRKMRASILVLGPLMSRIGKARVSLPGGCAIGARPINLHLKGLELMGAKLRLKEGYIEAKAGRLNGAHIYFDTPSVTGTENLIMTAVLAKGNTVLGNAAREPEVVALGQMLNQMGAKIKGLGSNTIKIEGVKELRPVDWGIIPDRIEAGTYMMAVGAAGGELIIKNVMADHLEAVISKLRSTGLQIEGDNARISVRKKGALHSVDVKTLPYPGFPTDLQAQIMVLMSLAGGLSVITETIFENRFMHVAELRRLGADIKVEGRSAIIKGVRGLNSAPVMATDLRASASLVLAGLAAKGTTTISRVYHLDRGYEHLEQKLAAVGAKIKREKA